MAPSNRNLYLAAFISCLTAALFGYSVGFIGGEIVLPSFLSHFHLDHVSDSELAAARSWAVTTWIIGALVGVPTAVPICSRFGRRLCLQFAAVLYVGGAFMQVFSKGNLVVFDVGRWVNGMGVGAGTLASPIFISEISPAEHRNMLMSAYQVFVQSGALIGFWVAFVAEATIGDGKALQWQLPVALQVLVGLVLVLGCLVIPESPRYLAEIGQQGPMLESLSWLRRLPKGDPQLEVERIEIEAAADLAADLKQVSLVSELAKKDVRRRLVVGVGIMIAQNLAGMNALNYFAPIIFMTAGFTSVSSSLLMTAIFGLVKLISALAFMFKFVHVRGNRFWLLLGSAVCAVAMLVLAYCVHISPPTQGASITFIGTVSVLMVLLFSFAFGVSLGPISWNICAEIFPLRINSACCAVTTCTQWAFQIVVAAMTPILLASLGWMTYLIFGGFCVLTLIWVAVALPETRGLGVGKPMDELFGAEKEVGDEEAVIEVSETTALLVHDRRRRSSLVAYA